MDRSQERGEPRAQPVIAPGTAVFNEPELALFRLDRRVRERRMPEGRTAVDSSGRGTPTRRYHDQADALCHDIRQPLATLSVLVASLQAVGSDEKSSRMVDDIATEIDWLSQFVTVFLEGSTVGTVSLYDIASAAAHSVSTARRRQVEVVQQNVASVRADRVLLHRAVSNLVDNACKAAQRIRVTVSRDGEWAAVDVEDDGPGFGPLSVEGTGRGMLIAHQILAGCGGHLETGKSSLGGARARLILPAISQTGRPL